MQISEKTSAHENSINSALLFYSQTKEKKWLEESLRSSLKVYEEARNAENLEGNSMDVPGSSGGNSERNSEGNLAENERISPALSDASIILDQGEEFGSKSF